MQRGFTLLEVLVALAILALALTAVMRALAQTIDVGASLRERTVALWVAQNHLAEHYLKRNWPAADTTDITVEMNGREWHLRQVVAGTQVAEIRRVDIEVRSNPDRQAVARLSGFLYQPSRSTP